MHSEIAAGDSADECDSFFDGDVSSGADFACLLVCDDDVSEGDVAAAERANGG